MAEDKSLGDRIFSFKQGCCINHSCAPNCDWIVLNGILVVEAKRDIRKGEEITISYDHDITALEGKADRRRALLQTYVFLCTCERCQAVIK